MHLLALSDTASITLWAINITASVGITICLARVAAATRKFERLEDDRDKRVDLLQEKLHKTATSLIDERFRSMTHELNGHVNNFGLTLESLKERIQSGDAELRGLGDRDQRIELAIAGKIESLKDYIRENTASKRDLEKHEQSQDRRLENVAQQVGKLSQDVAVLSAANGKIKGNA